MKNIIKKLSIEDLENELQIIHNDTLLSRKGDNLVWIKFQSRYDFLLSSYPYLKNKKYEKTLSDFYTNSLSIGLCNAIKGYGGKKVFPLNKEQKLRGVKWFIEQGADVNYRKGDENPPLIMVMPVIGGYSDFEIAKELITAGADVNIRGQYGRTPLICACYSGFPKFVELLVESGADVELIDDMGVKAENCIPKPFYIPRLYITKEERKLYPKTLKRLLIPKNKKWEKYEKDCNKDRELCHIMLSDRIILRSVAISFMDKKRKQLV